MSKKLSTYERKMKDPAFKKAYKESYQELLFSELLISLMEEDDKSVRKLAKEAHLSPSIIQNLRSGKQHDIKISNLISLAHVLGFKIILEKERDHERFVLDNSSNPSNKHFSLIAA